jgi:hypothetical protein
VLGNHGLRNTGALGEGVDSVFPVAREPFKNGSPGGIGQGFKDVIGARLHDQNHNRMVMNVSSGFVDYFARS